MAKKHIVKIGYQYYATDSINLATTLIANLAKMQKARYKPECSGYVYEPDPDKMEISLEMNQRFEDPAAKPVKPTKPLALPKPARGTIRCICDKSDVAPRQTCPHCGRPFGESHNRTHGSTTTEVHPTLRLLP